MKIVFSKRKHSPSVCPKTGKPARSGSKRHWLMWLFPVMGLLGLIWFLIRVVPKPSRATYPCQRVAFPLASGFIVWLIGVIGSVSAIRKAKRCFGRSRYVVGIICVAVSVGSLWLALSVTSEKTALADDPIPNAPIGIAKGVNPGRAIWVHDPEATDWAGPGDGHWWQSSHTNQAVVDAMMSRAIRGLSGEPNNALAWDKLFRNFNQTHHSEDIGYQQGEKITIKVNFVGTIGAWGPWEINSVEDYDLAAQRPGNIDYMNTSPQMILALLRQLVYVVEVNEADITVGDTLCYFVNEYYDLCHDEFPNVRYWDYEGTFGRTGVELSWAPMYWSTPDAAGTEPDFIPLSYTDADYIINMANLKSHASAGVTLCGKNHYGSLFRRPDGPDGHYDIHTDLPYQVSEMGSYRNLVDLMGHAQLGGKTMLYLIDGLYAGLHPTDKAPTKWENVPPFDEYDGGDWSSSILASQDPVAIDSVGFDFLWAEWDNEPHMAGTDDYLHEAAEANNPASGTFYDPDHPGDVTRLASLGVHEHWNNAADKQYSRNLDPQTGSGIELLAVLPADINTDGKASFKDLAAVTGQWLQPPGLPSADIAPYPEGDGVVDMVDYALLAEYWGK